MKFSIHRTDITENLIKTGEKCIIDDELWHLWYAEMMRRFIAKELKETFDTDECQECGWISWRHIFSLLKWLEGKATADYVAGKRIKIIKK